MNKGKIIEIQQKYVVVMNDQMAYQKIEKKNGLSIGKEIYYFEEDLYTEAKQPVKKYFLVAAVLFMMLFIQPLLVAEEAYGYISVDINPSIELEVNRELQVLGIEAINDDAKAYIKDEWIGKPAKEVIDLIIQETKSKGILNTERNFVLVSYFFNDEDSTSEEIFIQDLDELFNEKPHDYEVAVIKGDAKTYSEAKEAKESLGKQVVNKKMNTKVDDLLAAKASIEADEDFKMYKNNDDDDNDNIDKPSNEKALEDNPGQKNEKNPIFGQRDDVPGLNKENDDDDALDKYSDKDFKQTKKMITPPEAKTIALAIVKGRIIEVELDRDNSEAEYEIKLLLDKEIHELIIDGFSGEIISHEIDEAEADGEDEDHKGNNGKNNEDSKDDDDEDDNDNDNRINNQGNKKRDAINRKDIETIAFQILGGKGEIVAFDFDEEDEEAEYTLEIQLNAKIHEMKINGFTGELMAHEIEVMDPEEDEEALETSDENDDQPLQGVIDEKTAEKIAFEAIDGQGTIIDYDFDEDEPEYFFEIEFENNTYSIKIDAFSGEVIEYLSEPMDLEDEVEDEENNKHGNNSNNEQSVILREEIETIALELVSGEIIEISIEEDDEILEYRVFIQKENNRHELLISGITGEIIEHKKNQIEDTEKEFDESSEDEEDGVNTEEDDN